MTDAVHVLDASVFIQAAREYYAFDLAPGLWDKLVDRAEKGKIESIDRVKSELDKGNDDLTEWVNNQFIDAFKSTNSDEVIRLYRTIIAWVTQSNFFDAAKSKFASGADGWLVAYAMAKKRIISTQEVFNPSIKRKVPIPNVCREFNVRYVNTFDMLRNLKVQLTH